MLGNANGLIVINIIESKRLRLGTLFYMIANVAYYEYRKN
jgi:hypothetical protein